MKLSTDLEVDGTTRQTRAMCVPVGVTPLRTRRVQDLPEARSDYVVAAVLAGLLSAANSLLFWANGLQSAAVQSPGNGQTREGSDEGSARQSRISLLVEGNIDPCQKLSG